MLPIDFIAKWEETTLIEQVATILFAAATNALVYQGGTQLDVALYLVLQNLVFLYLLLSVTLNPHRLQCTGIDTLSQPRKGWENTPKTISWLSGAMCLFGAADFIFSGGNLFWGLSIRVAGVYSLIRAKYESNFACSPGPLSPVIGWYVWRIIFTTTTLTLQDPLVFQIVLTLVLGIFFVYMLYLKRDWVFGVSFFPGYVALALFGAPRFWVSVGVHAALFMASLPFLQNSDSKPTPLVTQEVSYEDEI